MTNVTKPGPAMSRAAQRRMTEGLLNDAFYRADASAASERLGDLAREVGMGKIAEITGFRRESLYRSLKANANPSLKTVLFVLKALGLRITIGYPRQAFNGAPDGEENPAMTRRS